MSDGLWKKRPEIDSIAEYTRGFEDTLHAPLQPLMDHLESSTYEVFEKDPVKYKLYYEATKQALIDKNLNEATVFMVGAGRGPIVNEIIRAADDANKKVFEDLSKINISIQMY